MNNNFNDTMNAYSILASEGKQYALDIMREWTKEDGMKIFQIDEPLTNLFLNTKNKIGYRECPFFRLFLECSFPIKNSKVGDILVKGITIGDTHIMYEQIKAGIVTGK